MLSPGQANPGTDLWAVKRTKSQNCDFIGLFLLLLFVLQITSTYPALFKVFILLTKLQQLKTEKKA